MHALRLSRASSKYVRLVVRASLQYVYSTENRGDGTGLVCGTGSRIFSVMRRLWRKSGCSQAPLLLFVAQSRLCLVPPRCASQVLEIQGDVAVQKTEGHALSRRPGQGRQRTERGCHSGSRFSIRAVYSNAILGITGVAFQ